MAAVVKYITLSAARLILNQKRELDFILLGLGTGHPRRSVFLSGVGSIGDLNKCQLEVGKR